MTKLRNRNKTKRRHHVTKRRSHRTRSQRGGGWLPDWLTGSTNDTYVANGLPESPSYLSKLTNYFTGPTDLENVEITDSIKKTVDEIDAKLGEAKDDIIEEASVITEKAKETIGYGKNTLIGSPDQTPSPSPPTPPPIVTGGKSRKHKNRKGGSNLGLLYYATPVNSVSMKGGKRHKHTCCKNKGKGKRHRHSASCSQK
jgi:hypothetical protein